MERAQETVSAKETERLTKQLRKQRFTLEDFLSQLRQVQKMGPLEDLLKMIPGIGGKIKQLDIDPKAMKRIEAIILSMTPRERDNPRIIDGSRRRRISRGSGTTVQEVNQLLKRFQDMNRMMKRFSKMPKGRSPFPI